ncbi:2OG-Fe(II) oxygenase [Marinilongibacter aquaticus]|uniref:2OG-Fe(II) oxygenase n=1 Tax=Marinilongibacter aquaticus TaxID=2975157 RepID=UPI0021BD742A|nr:2OG-Fe(II) oxygenase [Marinilongibacter aquaticus]UBM57393.1 2OG-Fe(II) oxygenase [Marinilongibacter aquaticus]
MKLYFNNEQLDALAKKHAGEYKKNEPFPHVVIDNFMDPEALDKVLEEFPNPGTKIWHDYSSHYEKKQELNGEGKVAEFTQHLLYQFNSAPFLVFLEKLTGIDNLIPDPYFFGGGLHQLNGKGKLGVHADYSKHVRWPLDRRVNAILYLNKDWKEEYNGHLELWDTEMTECKKKVLPVFNRLLVFNVTDFNMHGVPEEVKCPEGMSRKSLAFFYFTNGRPAEEVDQNKKLHVKFTDRPGDDKPATVDTDNIIGYEKNPIKRFIKQVTPPIIYDSLKSLASK